MLGVKRKKQFNQMKYFFVIAFCASVLALVAVHIGDIYFDLQPCKLCVYQRWVYVAIGTSAGLGFLLQRCRRKIIAMTILLILLEGMIAFFHFGVEHKWVEYNSGCSTVGFNQATSTEDLKQMIMSRDLVFCDAPVLVFGFSIAGWNLLYSVLILVAC